MSGCNGISSGPGTVAQLFFVSMGRFCSTGVFGFSTSWWAHVVLLRNQEARFRDAAVSQAGATAACENLERQEAKETISPEQIFLKDFPEQKLLW